MNKVKYLIESLSDDVKWEIIDYLNEDGYATYARRLKAYKFAVAHVYHGAPIPVAAMFPNENLIVINPNMLDESKLKVTDNPRLPYALRQEISNDKRTLQEKKMEQLSVVIRHELLHFLLVHAKRLIDMLEKKHPEWKNIFSMAEIANIANIAEDYEISILGYDEHDKHAVRLLTLNNQVVGGLIAEDDHPEWKDKTMEEMLEILMQEAAQYKTSKEDQAPETVIKVHKVTHSPEYVKMYNDILALLDNNQYSDADLDQILALAESGDDVLDLVTGEVYLRKGE